SGLAYVACLQNNLSEACRHFGEVLAYALRLKDYVFLVATLPGAALFLARLDRAEQAVAMWARAHHEPFIANSKWFEDLVGRHISAAAERLPAADAVQARTQGEKRDLWETAEELRKELKELAL
ncbi:MAG TPA: hypothetical protein VE553_09450, partial [Candidatus Binatia bacterium]|nr:hypothetical protein [Candidatus Binatia bacterium]